MNKYGLTFTLKTTTKTGGLLTKTLLTLYFETCLSFMKRCDLSRFLFWKVIFYFLKQSWLQRDLNFLFRRETCPILTFYTQKQISRGTKSILFDTGRVGAYTAQKMKISLIDIFFVRCSNRNSVPVPYLWSEHESDSPSSWLPWKEYFFPIYMDTIKCPIKFNELYRCLTILLLQFSSIYMQLCKKFEIWHTFLCPFFLQTAYRTKTKHSNK